MRMLRWLYPLCDHRIGRALFVRAIGIIYLVAIVSWWVQAEALIGAGGLVPVSSFLDRAGEFFHVEGKNPAWNLPTLFWISSSDGFIHVVCAIGVILALLVVAGVVTGPCLLGLWLIYLSLVNTGNVFMSFQWDILLLEAGVLAILVAPWSVRFLSWKNPPPLGWGERIALWLCWFAVAKLMFQSGWVKLAWATENQPEWWPDHTAMTFHYMTQPLPTWTAWWMHQLPEWFHKVSIWPMYFVELVLPIFVFLGVRFRLVAALGFSVLMLLILLTGNYTYFNWLTITMCLPLVADRYWKRLPKIAARVRKKGEEIDRDSREWGDTPITPSFREQTEIVSIGLRGIPLALVAVLNAIVCLGDWHRPYQAVPTVLPATHLQWDLVPDPAEQFQRSLSQFHLVSGYGLFRTMTIDRPEIVIEGSRDGIHWEEYDLRWKPDKLHARPRFVAPHQPRVAWQFWFAALERGYHPSSRNAAWLSSLLRGLLENDPAALSFFNGNPFPGEPPAMVQSKLYLYEFTSPEERRRTGDWWKRRSAGEFLPRMMKRPASD